MTEAPRSTPLSADPPHTPGPWEVVESLNDYYVTMADRRTKVADIWKARDARLIAAAPELLALAEAYEAWEADIIMNADWEPIDVGVVVLNEAQYNRMIELQTMRNAALEKARGLQPQGSEG